MSVFDGLADIFTDPDTGFGEPVIYTFDESGESITINAIWTETSILDGGDVQASGRRIIVDVRSADVPSPQENDTVQRVKTGTIGIVVPPIESDDGPIDMNRVTLERQES